MEKMKAARLHKLHESPKIDEDVPVPQVGPHDVLVRIKAVGICHTDLSICSGYLPPPRLPLILGHEPAGVIERVGERVDKVKVGDRVCIDPIISCGWCHYCNIGRDNLCPKSGSIGFDFDGAWADYVSVPQGNVFKLPDNIPFDQGAIISDAVATSFHAMRTGEVKPGDVVAIFGVGGLGVNAIQLAKAFGATKVIAVDRKESKLEVARAVGADETADLNSPSLRKDLIRLSGGDGVDVAFEFIGLGSTIEKTLECVRRGGKAVFVGVYEGDFRVKAHPMMVKEIDMRWVWVDLKRDYPPVIELVRSGKVDLSKSISHRLPFDQVNRGLEILEKKIDNPLRIVLTFED